MNHPASECLSLSFLLLFVACSFTVISTFTSPWFARILDAQLFLNKSASNVNDVDKLPVWTSIDFGLFSGCNAYLYIHFGDRWKIQESVPCEDFMPNNNISLEFDFSWVNQCKTGMVVAFVTEFLSMFVILSSAVGFYNSAVKKVVKFLWPIFVLILLLIALIFKTIAVISTAEYQQTWLTVTNYNSIVNIDFSVHWFLAAESCVLLCLSLITYGIWMVFFIIALIKDNRKSFKSFCKLFPH